MHRTALITGATGGLGREVAHQLHAAGFAVFVTGRSTDRLAALQRELQCPGLALDLTPAEAAPRLYAAACETLGRVDVLINNAGFNRAKEPILTLTAEDLDASYAVNVRAPMLLAREALRDMAARGTGHIVNVISSIVHVKMENYALYTAMKHALYGFTGCLIKEARASGVKVTAVLPGGINTRFRPNPRPDYLRPASAAAMIVACVTAPQDVVVHELTFRPMVETNF